VSPERLPLHAEVWWLAFKPSVAGEAHNNRATAIISNRVAIRELNGMNGYELALLSISVT
jgi:mRNA-degrading endonuclease toxin of MazEF toxin-antitoxin module